MSFRILKFKSSSIFFVLTLRPLKCHYLNSLDRRKKLFLSHMQHSVYSEERVVLADLFSPSAVL